MKDDANNPLDVLIKNLIKEDTIERPSLNFSEAVMSRIEILKENKVTVYKPLISKWGWTVVVSLCVTVLFYVLFFGNQSESMVWFNTLDFSVIGDVISGFRLSKVGMYSVLLFGIMFCVQISFLKQHFEKRIE
ncbi:hypothetical protein [Aestuariivivens sediminis]|uniref:hypothetical protein n=1 Tax=Aestuariivivens sediminis TaxID=2913557 RepID=UPI001F591C5A|nr:hypothetical protein [Aestuariivivens sediminis]